MSYSLLEWFSVISLILNFSRLLLIKAGLNRLKLIKATGWQKFNLSRLFSNPECYLLINDGRYFATSVHWRIKSRFGGGEGILAKRPMPGYLQN